MIRTLKRFYKTVRHGTAIESMRYRLKSLGIDIAPYYLIEEGHDFIPSREFKQGAREYVYEFLGPGDMAAVKELTTWKSTEEHWLSLLKEGKKCFAARYNGRIVASMWIALDECSTEWGKFKLNHNEAYLFSMCTDENFRGQHIASYLRYESYQALKSMGRDCLHSYSSAFNKSSIKFKKRLNARTSKFGVYVEIFEKIRRNFMIKDYGGRPLDVSRDLESPCPCGSAETKKRV